MPYIMSGAAPDGDDAQSAYGDGPGGPGAPTPLSALEVGYFIDQRIVCL